MRGEAELIDELCQLLALYFRHLQTHQHAAIGGTVIAVMEKADVPCVVHGRKELQ